MTVQQSELSFDVQTVRTDLSGRLKTLYSDSENPEGSTPIVLKMTTTCSATEGDFKQKILDLFDTNWNDLFEKICNDCIEIVEQKVSTKIPDLTKYEINQVISQYKSDGFIESACDSIIGLAKTCPFVQFDFTVCFRNEVRADMNIRDYLIEVSSSLLVAFDKDGANGIAIPVIHKRIFLFRKPLKTNHLM